MELILSNITTEQREALGWAIDTAYDELTAYLEDGNPSYDHGKDFWPEIARNNAKRCRSLAELCLENGEDERWEALAIQFIASAQAAEFSA